MPVIRHNNESAEVESTFLFHRETEGRDDDRACLWIENRLLWME